MKTLFFDILVAGQCYYKVTVASKGETPDIEVLNPFDVFYERNYDSPFVKDSSKVVVRRYLNKQQIIAKYGSKLTKEDIDNINSKLIGDTIYNQNVMYVRTEAGSLISNVGVTTTDAIEDNNYYLSSNLYPVYEIEWLSNNKYKDEEGNTKYRTDRYEVIKIGDDIYICLGKDEEVIRSIEHPDRCQVSVGGVAYGNRNGAPFSLVLATANLQDKYNILYFHRDNLIASSGIKGDFLDIAQLPSFLGKTPQERLVKWATYKKKIGVALINTAQDGGQTNLNTIYKGYDDTLDGNAIQAIQLAISQIEEVCSSITGVYRERLGDIEQRDAVSNVEVGIKQSAIITKQYHSLMDNITAALLKDALNAAKISYKHGMMGSIILGNKLQKIFTIDPKYFSFTDYDVHIADNDDIYKDMQKIENITYKFIEAGNVDPDIVLEGISSESISDFKHEVLKSINKKKEENNQLMQMNQQLQEYQSQIQQLQKELEKAQKSSMEAKDKELQLQNKKIENDYEIKNKEVMNQKSKIQNDYEIDKQRTDIEYGQMFDGNPHNDIIRNA